MRRNIVIFDFEVFKFDTLLGAIVLRDDDAEVFQTWNLAEMIKFYEANKQSIWVGHNNAFYDNFQANHVLRHQVIPMQRDIEIRLTRMLNELVRLLFDGR